MEDKHLPNKDHQIIKWLEKLQRESWQLELLVSAFTIFLLVGASSEYTEFYSGLTMQYSVSGIIGIIYVFLGLVGVSIKALAVFLVIHLLLRGFWIGSIGLRSVQATIDFNKLNYSPFFTEKLKKRVTSLDDLVILLDEICSVIFSFSFLVISIILSFGLYMLFLGLSAIILGTFAGLASGPVNTIISILLAVIFMGVVLTGLIYLIDYFTLGFFKKFGGISKVYYPIYRFYGFITLAAISRSIYYYMISKFSKRRIRIVYSAMISFILIYFLVGFDQYQFYPDGDNQYEIVNNYYADMRPEDDYVRRTSIQSKVIAGDFLEVFVRYDPGDNANIRNLCPEFTPLKKEGFRPRLHVETDGGNFIIRRQVFSEEDQQRLLACISSFYQVSINDSIYSDLNFYFFRHPSKSQLGLMTMIPIKDLSVGENLLQIKKMVQNPKDSLTAPQDFAYVPFWKN